MTMHFVSEIGANQCYLERTPERLVLEGYRHWTAGFMTGSIEPWEMAWNMYAVELGSVDGRKALTELSNFIRTLNQCASCPLRAFPFESHHICLDECLTMGLIAGLQHDDDTASLCLDYISCPSRGEEIEHAARSYATTLSALDQTLLPIPAHVITDVVSRSHTRNLH